MQNIIETNKTARRHFQRAPYRIRVQLDQRNRVFALPGARLKAALAALAAWLKTHAPRGGWAVQVEFPTGRLLRGWKRTGTHTLLPHWPTAVREVLYAAKVTPKPPFSTWAWLREAANHANHTVGKPLKTPIALPRIATRSAF